MYQETCTCAYACPIDLDASHLSQLLTDRNSSNRVRCLSHMPCSDQPIHARNLTCLALRNAYIETVEEQSKIGMQLGGLYCARDFVNSLT